MVLGVDGEDPAGADEQGVDVGATVAHGNGVEGPLARVPLRNLREFTVCSNAPRPFVSVHP
jgi:hypothetical protein